MVMKDRRAAEVFPPGEFLKEELEARGWTQTDLAEILGRPLRLVNEIISGKRGISPETAKGLGDALGTSAQFWLNLESAYQLSRVPSHDDAVARRARLYDRAPIKEMIRRNWIEHSQNVAVLEQRVLDFLGVKNLDEQPEFYPHAARKSSGYEQITPAQRVWLLRSRQLAPAVSASPFSRRRLNDLVRQLRTLTQSPEDVRHVPRLLANMGIRLLVVEPLAGTRIDGVCFWLDDRSPVVVLSLRYDRIDYFWYTLMHELGHVRNRDGLDSDWPSLDTDIVGQRAQKSGGKPQAEELADQFAVETLIPQEDLEDFILRVRPLYSAMRIQGFANRIGVHAGIVVGQLQHRGEVSYAQHRRMLSPVRHIITHAALTDGWGTSLPAAM
jgi:HTH-type transcriptional regulator/antitoxin HigA